MLFASASRVSLMSVSLGLLESLIDSGSRLRLFLVIREHYKIDLRRALPILRIRETSDLNSQPNYHRVVHHSYSARDDESTLLREFVISAYVVVSSF